MSFHSKLRELYTKRSEHIFLHVDGDEISYYTVQKRADTISAFFRMQGCVPGSCIVYLHSSLRSYIEVMLACIQAGFTFYPLGAWQDEPDFFDTVKGQAPAFLFCDPDQLGCSPELLARKLPGTRIVLSGGSRPKSSAFLTYQQVVSRPLHFEPEPISADTPVIRYMDVISRSLLSCTYGQVTEYLDFCCENCRHRPERTIMCLPFISRFSLQELLYALAGGDTLYLCNKLSAKEFIKTVEWNRITSVCLIPYLIDAVHNDIQFLKGDLSSIRSVRLGQATLYPDMEQYLKDLLPPTCVIEKLTGFPRPYFSIRISAAELCDPSAAGAIMKVNAAGYPVQGCEVRVDSRSFSAPAPIYVQRNGGPWEYIRAKGWMDDNGLVYLTWDAQQPAAHFEHQAELQPLTCVIPKLYYGAPSEKYISDKEQMTMLSYVHSGKDTFQRQAGAALSRILDTEAAAAASIERNIPVREIRNTIAWQLDYTLPPLKVPTLLFRGDGTAMDISGGLSDRRLIFCPVYENKHQPIGAFYYIAEPGRQIDDDLIGAAAFLMKTALKLYTEYQELSLNYHLFQKVSDLSDNTVSFSRLEHNAMLYYANSKACELINLGKQNQYFASMMENAQNLNMEDLAAGASTSSHSFFFTNSDLQKIWVNYRVEQVQIQGEDYAITFGTRQESTHSMAHLNDLLSDRELEVIHCLARGLSNQEIANELIISVNTVKYHISNLYKKLQVSSRAELLANIMI